MKRIAWIATVLVACAAPAVVDAGPVVPSTTSAGTPQPATTGPIDQSGTTTPSQPAETVGLSAYFLVDEVQDRPDRPGPFLVPVYREVEKTQAVARAALEQLLAGPSQDEMSGIPTISSGIPAETVLLDVTVEDGLATVDLSKEFESGGGTFSMTARLAQVVYTVTQFPTVDRVTFRLDGEPVTVFSGEGILLEEPVGRDQYLDLLPLIFVDHPAWGAPAGNPARVVGRGAVFEAQFQWSLADGDGLILAEAPAMTSEGQGWGDFDFTIPYSVQQEEIGSLVVWDYSAKDGSMENVREYPVRLTPAA